MHRGGIKLTLLAPTATPLLFAAAPQVAAMNLSMVTQRLSNLATRSAQAKIKALEAELAQVTEKLATAEASK
jgi:uncharacterized protein YceH (UPF0502 family)